MNSILAFTAGFGAGWIGRSAFESSHEAIVDLAALVMQTVERLKRVAFIEGERLEDMIAEAKAHAKAHRTRHPGRGGVNQSAGSAA